MTPYYADDAVTIYHGDVEEVLADLDITPGLVLTSPPYNLGGARGTEWSPLEDGYDGHHDDMPHGDYVAWQHRVIGRCWQLLADDGAIYYQHKPIARGNETRLPFELIPPGIPVRQVITWDRGSGFQRTHVHYVPRYEWILVCARPAFRITTLDVFDLWQIPPDQNNRHPAPFPLKLARQAIGTTSADLVLDPYAGSGTTLRAAKDLGRHAVGIEQSERYCEIAARRCAQEVLAL